MNNSPMVKAAPVPNTPRPSFDDRLDAVVRRFDAVVRRFDDVCKDDFGAAADDQVGGGRRVSGGHQPKMPKYNPEAVESSIKSAERRGPKISGKGRKNIHALLKGRHDDGRDDDGSMSFPARRRHRMDDDAITAAGARKAARMLAGKGKADAGRTARGPRFEQPERARRARLDDDRVVNEVLVRDRRRDDEIERGHGASGRVGGKTVWEFHPERDGAVEALRAKHPKVRGVSSERAAKMGGQWRGTGIDIHFHDAPRFDDRKSLAETQYDPRQADTKQPRITGHNNYEYTHGHKPRGTGNWMFKHEGGKLHDQITEHRGSFTEAGKDAQRHGAKHGTHTLHVQT